MTVDKWISLSKASLSRLVWKLNEHGDYEAAAVAQANLVQLDLLHDTLAELGDTEEPMP